MRRCAFLTLDDATGYVVDDQLAYPYLHDLGWRIDEVPWRRPDVRWDEYDAIIIRSTWDYTKDADAFATVLRQIDRSGAPLFNDLGTVCWNMRKTYLRDLNRRGVPTVPTVWRPSLAKRDIERVMAELGVNEAVLKPVVGAGASGVFSVNDRSQETQAAAIEAYYANRAVMVQPFLPGVVSEGEFSLCYLNGRFSHAVVKKPKAGDFRVQEEHGGVIMPVEATDELLEAGERALAALDEPPLYARADVVRSNDGAGYWLMELELIEPSLFLRMDKEAPRRMAQAIDERVAQWGANR